MKHNISWKKRSIETVASDSVVLKGEIKYWAKDYVVYLKEPFFAKDSGAHLMYSIPAQYITTEEECREEIKNIDISPSAKERLLSLYYEKKCKK